MPTSHYSQIGKIVEMMVLIRAQSVLDIGVGYGKYGMLAREFLEMWLEDKPYEQRKIKIDGIEAFPEYVHDGHRYYYDEIFIGNASNIIAGLASYDLILLIDVLEHFSYDDGRDLLRQCASKGRHVIISTPRDIGEQGAVHGNEFERHQFQWEKKHLKEFGTVTFFRNHRSMLCMIGPEGKEVKRIMSNTHTKFLLRSRFPRIYAFYRKNIRPLFYGNEFVH